MQLACFCPKHLKLILLIALLSITVFAKAQYSVSACAFAHNDYWHKRPLYDALNNGYTHIEADVYLRHNKLIVAHLLPSLKKNNTLERLYLDPLMNCINGTDSTTRRPAFPLTLMIDIKSNGEHTYEALNQLLQKYRSVLSGVEDGHFTQREITIVLSGHKPVKRLKEQSLRWAFIDDDLKAVGRDTAAVNIYQTASCKYSSLIQWRGKGDLPFYERQRLCRFVNMAHKFGKKVRLWKSPDNPVVWNALLQCGVDLINTDKLVKLRQFLTGHTIVAVGSKHSATGDNF